MDTQTRPPLARRRTPSPQSRMAVALAEPPSDGLTVQETAERTGLSEHTLRYYERAGLLSAIRRDGSSGHRRYSADDVARISTLACLRATGMPLDQMRRYFTLAARGRDAARELRALLQEQEDALEERMRGMQRHLDYVRRKIDYWKALEAGHDAAARRIADELACQTGTTT
jgi:MerR family transcriptional regulator, aldehyde-responsive regulator